MDVDEIVKEVKRVKSFISGITVSGGECMLQAEFLKELFVEIKNMELSIFVDTNGSVPFWENSELTALMDKAMVDMKAFLPEEHIGLTGMDNKNVLKNIEYLASIDKLYELRTVIVPDILDNYFNVDAISKLIAALNPDIRYKLIKYRPFGVRKELMISQIPSDNMMKELVQISRENGCINIVVT
jgi:pyruvate-formate lyase-activating enzyme